MTDACRTKAAVDALEQIDASLESCLSLIRHARQLIPEVKIGTLGPNSRKDFEQKIGVLRFQASLLKLDLEGKAR